MSRYGYYGYGYGYNRYSSSSESQHNQRILRAFEQPLQLLRCRYFPNSSKWEIHISSSTGQGSYELNLTSKTGKCNCPDFERRHKPCKHMLCFAENFEVERSRVHFCKAGRKKLR